MRSLEEKFVYEWFAHVFTFANCDKSGESTG